MILGIDLGTTNSSSAFLNDESKPEVIINEKGQRLTPSVVFFKNLNEVVVGENAAINNPLEDEKIIKNIKRRMGENYRAKVLGREFTPSEISSLILKKIKKYSEEFLSEKITDTVITVPAYFNHKQRAATKRAGEIAGFERINIINEPTSALLAYNFINIEKEKNSVVVVVDIGGGTFDITIMESKDGVQKVLATGGDIRLGGIDFDEKIVELLIKNFKSANDFDLRNDPIALNQLYISSRKAKEDLSTLENTTIVIPYITISEKGPLHLKYELTRKEFELISKDIVERILSIIEKTFNENNISYKLIDKILFVGGSTRIPFLRERIIRFFENKTEKSREYLLPKAKINPDEVVSMGAAIYGGIIEGKVKDMEFFDVVSYYLGIEEESGNFVPVINKNETYPLVKTKVFTTVYDNQEYIKIKILQKRELEEEANELGYFYLENLPKVEAGTPNIDVEFAIDKSGILKVVALDLDSGKVNDIIIEDFERTNDFIDERRGKNIIVL